MTTVLRASDSAQFLGIVPALAGFTPHESIALLPFHGTRSDGTMRLDLPDAAVPLLHYAAAAVELVVRVPDTDAVAVVVYTDEPPQRTPDGLVLPHAVMVDTLLGCAEGAGLRAVEALCVTPEGWARYDDAEPALHPLSDIVPPPDASADCLRFPPQRSSRSRACCADSTARSPPGLPRPPIPRTRR